ncbi:polysaccharide biosynthesis tyrosine autokinase [Arthrobacter sp. NPDC080073]|uniref:polysaccharide biosynthesis tyrosine autokinase n=1 Tax=Arthrobacter sp. NPDC080073 TaxID=3155919 RepID=UPI00342791A8
MDLRDYTRIIRRNWILIVAITLVGIVLSGAASILVKPTYTSETQLFVAIQGSGSVSELQQGNTFSQARVQSYVKTVDTPAVLKPALESLGGSDSTDDLAKRVKASTDLNTVLINIAVSDESPAQAAAYAQAIATSLIKVVDALEKPKTGGTSPVSLSIIRPAEAPTSPSAPNTKLNLFLGFFIGAVVGFATAVLRTRMDTKIRGEADLRKVTAASLLGAISFTQDAAKKPLLTQTPHQSPRAESFRQLRTNLQFANVSGGAKSILVTSSLPGEGKSTTATNLAISLSQAGSTVCLIDADLRRPRVNEYLGLDRSAGLTTALVGDADLNDLLQPWGEDNLYVLASGQIPPNPSELLGSEAMRNLLLRLEKSFDIIIVDAPPLLPVTDAAVLSQHVGGVVVVTACQAVKTQDLEKSLKALDLVGGNLLGVVLNKLPAKGPDAYTYSYYSHDTQPTKAESAYSPSSEETIPLMDDDPHRSSDFDSILIRENRREPRSYPLH